MLENLLEPTFIVGMGATAYITGSYLMTELKKNGRKWVQREWVGADGGSCYAGRTDTVHYEEGTNGKKVEIGRKRGKLIGRYD
jgi:hypothetical protein